MAWKTSVCLHKSEEQSHISTNNNTYKSSTSPSFTKASIKFSNGVTHCESCVFGKCAMQSFAVAGEKNRSSGTSFFEC